MTFPHRKPKPLTHRERSGLPELHLTSNAKLEQLEAAQDQRTRGTPMLDKPLRLGPEAGRDPRARLPRHARPEPE